MTITQRIVEVNEVSLSCKARKEKPRIVVIIPAFNEEKAIKNVVNKTRDQLRSITDDFSIIVVDDDSNDNTRKILDALEVDRFYHRKNLGKGDVIKNVLEFLVPSEIVVTLDGDGEHDPADMGKLINPIISDQADMVIGSRFFSRLNNHRGYLGRKKDAKHIKHLGNKFFTVLLWIFTRKTIHDTQSGYRAFKASTIKHLKLSSDGFRIEMEMTVKALRRGFRVTEVSIANRQGRRESHLKIATDGTKIAMTVFRESLPKILKRFFDWFLPRIPERLGRFIN